MANEATTRAMAFSPAGTRELLVTAALVALAVLVRAQALTWPATDSDVGSYLLVARSLQHGILPYVNVWEYKPPGAFALYAIAMWLTPTPGIALALLGDLAVIASALLVRRIAMCLDPVRGRAAGTVAAIFVILLSIENDGLMGDVELLIVPLSAAAVAMLLPASRTSSALWRYAAAGLFVGAAVQLKLTAIPFALFIFCAIAWKERRNAAGPLAVAIAACVAPWVIEIGAYAGRGQLAYLADANIGATVRRLGSRGQAPARLDRCLEELRVLAPPIELAIVAFVMRLKGLGIVFAWFVVAAATIVVTNEYDARHFFSLLAPASLLAAFALERIGTWLRRPALITGLVVAVTFAMHDYYTVVQAFRYAYYHAVLHEAQWHRSSVERIADVVRPCTAVDPSLYVVGESPILYDMLNVTPPTRYVFPTNLFDRSKWRMLGFDGSVEVQRILATHPSTIVVGGATLLHDPGYDDPASMALLAQVLNREYIPVAMVDHQTIYRLQSAAIAGPPTCRATRLRPSPLALYKAVSAI